MQNQDEQVYDGTMVKVKILQAFPYFDEEGNEKGTMEVDSTQEVPMELANDWVEKGLAEIISDETAQDKETADNDVEVTTETTESVQAEAEIPSFWMGNLIVGEIESTTMQDKVYKKFSTENGSNFLISEEEFNNNVTTQ